MFVPIPADAVPDEASECIARAASSAARVMGGRGSRVEMLHLHMELVRSLARAFALELEEEECAGLALHAWHLAVPMLDADSGAVQAEARSLTAQDVAAVTESVGWITLHALLARPIASA